MKCQFCKVEMEIGFAIEPRFHGNERCFMPLHQTMKIDEIKIIDCWKCLLCGHSDDGKD